jgi:Undecaprenyl-phosphate glucose phosphotransferase
MSAMPDIRAGSTSCGEQFTRQRIRLSYQSLPPLVMALDFIWIIAVSVATGILYHLTVIGNPGDLAEYLGCGLAVSALFCMSARSSDLYRASSLSSPSPIVIRKALFIWTMVFLCLTTVAFTLKISNSFSRGASLLFFASGILGILVSRKTISRFLTHLLTLGALSGRRIAVITDSTTHQPELVQSFKRYGYAVSGVFDIDSDAHKKMAAVLQHARQSPLDEIIVAIPWDKTILIEQIVGELRSLPCPVKLFADPIVNSLLSRPLLELGPGLAIELVGAPLTVGQRAAKRVIDITISIVGLLLLTPVIFLIAFAIRLDSRGPVFFTQTRVGFNGRTFNIYKFRTMNICENGPTILQVRINDDRVTKIGRFLRRLSLDEVPQLLNVLRGDMSLVGPRPHALAHDNEYDKLIASYAMRRKMKPGITGLAQIAGCRGETPHVDLMKRRVDHDLRYIENWSFWFDLRILSLTLFHVLTSRQAY